MKVSIITVSFNAAGTIAETLESVADQDWPHIEHIVVDGASSDATMDLVRAHSRRLSCIVSEPDRGVYDAMNKGLALATGDVVAFLNADDVYLGNGVVRSAVEALADPAVDACHADLVYCSLGDSSRIVRRWRSGPHRPKACLVGWMPPHPTFFARRGLYSRFGSFDLRYRLQSDFDLMLRFFELHGVRSRHVPEVWVRMRMGGLSNRSIGNVLRGNLEAWLACRRNGFRVTPWFMVRKVAGRVSQFLSR